MSMTSHIPLAASPQALVKSTKYLLLQENNRAFRLFEKAFTWRTRFEAVGSLRRRVEIPEAAAP